jgi:L-amino acid N-acyltransferase YncA
MDSAILDTAQVGSLPAEIVRVTGTDGISYSVRLYEWTLEKAEKYASEFFRVGIFTDDVPNNVNGFLRYLGQAGTIWFETVETESGKHIGFMYVSDLLPSWTERRFLSATWHAVVWDARAAPRREVAAAFIREIFKLLKLHRLAVSIPLKFGGAIRNSKLLGFKEDGVVRSVRRYKGEWYNVLLMSILEDEVTNGRQ